MKRNKHYFKFTVWILFTLGICGCGIFKNITDSVTGRYIKGLEQQTEKAKSQIFDYGITDCFGKITHILEDMQAKILKIDIYKYSILASVSREGMEEEDDDIVFDTNNVDVGIFLTEEGPDKTRVKISCLSSVFLDYSSQAIFSKLQQRK